VAFSSIRGHKWIFQLPFQITKVYKWLKTDRSRTIKWNWGRTFIGLWSLTFKQPSGQIRFPIMTWKLSIKQENVNWLPLPNQSQAINWWCKFQLLFVQTQSMSTIRKKTHDTIKEKCSCLKTKARTTMCEISKTAKSQQCYLEFVVGFPMNGLLLVLWTCPYLQAQVEISPPFDRN
jgi:hypothetical protein